MAEEAIPQASPMTGDIVGDMGRAAVIERIDPLLVVDKVRHLLRGERYDFESGRWVPEEWRTEKIGNKFLHKPLANDEGIGKLTNFFASVCNSNVTLSEFNKSEIRNLTQGYVESLADTITLNMRRYGIDIAEATSVWNILAVNGFASFKRGFMGSDKDFISKVSKEQSRVEVKPESKKGFFSMIKK